MSDYRMAGYDPETRYRLHILKGINEQIDSFPELKDNGLSVDWAGENGTERYHGIKKFRSKTYSIPCAVLCSTSLQYETSLQAFKDFLLTAGEFNLDIISRNKRLKVSYLNMTDFRRHGNNALFTLALVDDHPTENYTLS